MKSTKSIFTCQSCGYQTPKWMGKCPDCGEWDTLVEELQPGRTASGPGRGLTTPFSDPVPIDAVDIEDDKRMICGIMELDRVLGGGLVPGSLVLIGGDPGIGKSTLMLQNLHALATQGYKVLYVSGEESIRQIRLRSKRLETLSSDLLVVSEIDLERILSMVGSLRPDVLVIDSIQTMYSADLTSAPGSVSQVRESATQLMLMAKKSIHPDVPSADRLSNALRIYGVYYEPSSGRPVDWRIHRTPVGLSLFTVIGVLAGMFGLGAGWANVPVLNLVMGAPLKISVATSKFLLSITDTSAAWIYLNKGCVIPLIVVPSLVGIMLGSFVGVRVLRIVRPSLVRWIVIVILAFAGLKSLSKGLGF